MAELRNGAVAVVTAGTVVAFDKPMPDAGYVVVWVCQDTSDPSITIGCTVNSALFTTSGFTVSPEADGTFRYIAAWESTASQRLSKDWTAASIWAEAVRDLHLDDMKELIHAERFLLINRAVESVVGEFYALLASAYRVSTSIAAVNDATAITTPRIMYAATEPRLILESTLTTAVGPVSEEELRIFRASAPQNKNRIAWAFSGDYILLKKGSGLASYGTLTLRYSRVPTLVSADTQKLDVPDGPIVELVIAKLKSVLGQRYARPVAEDVRVSVQQVVKNLYDSMGLSISFEEVKDKAARIL